MKKSLEELENVITETKLIPGQLWRHYKGTVYEIDIVTIDCNTNEAVIIYHDVNASRDEPIIPFSRVFSEWNTDIDGTPRFVRVILCNVQQYLTPEELKANNEARGKK